MNKRRFMFVAVVVLLLVLLVTTPAYAGKGNQPGTWYGLAPLPDLDGPGPRIANVEGAAVGGVGDTLIVAFGNEKQFGDTAAVRLYDIPSNTWSLGAPAPGGPRAELAYGELAHAGKFYAIGGRGGLDRLDCYDVAADMWTTLATMPTPRSAAAAAIVGNAIYVIGGRTTGGGPGSGLELAVVERYDIAGDTWTTVASLPGPRSDMAVVSHGGKIYVFGGYTTGGTMVSDVDMYNPVKDTWTSLTPMGNPRASLMAGKVGNYAYLIGGMGLIGLVRVNEVYNITKDSWSLDAPMPGLLPGKAVCETGAYSHGGGIYIPGGGQPAYGTGVDFNQLFKP